MLLCLFLFTFVISTIPEPKLIMDYINGVDLGKGIENPMFVLVYNVLGVVIFLGFAAICYKRYEKKLKNGEIGKL